MPGIYDKSVRPNAANDPFGENPPDIITYNLWLEDIYSISETGLLNVSVRVTEWWTDTRLVIPDSLTNIESIELDVTRIWRPTGSWDNLKKTEYATFTARLYQDSRVV